jgi:hypothetical protein
MASQSTPRIIPAFYRMSDPLSNSAFRGDVDDVATYREMEVAKRGEGHPSRVPVIHHSMGRKLCDFIWVSLVPIIHQRVVDLLTLGGVTGWATYPVQVFDREGVPVPGYHGLSITGRCESIFVDRKRAEVVYRDLPGGRFPYYKGLHLTTESWDGSDVFTAADGKTGHIVVTEKVRDLFAKARVTNVEISPILEYVSPESAEDLPSYPKAGPFQADPTRPQ